MRILVSDANIFIDMEVGGLLKTLFRLRETITVPDILFVEELAQRHPELPGHGLEVRELDPATVAAAMGFAETYRRPGRNDLFALALAAHLRCPLVTGDADLRDVAEREGVEVHGTLWLMERFVATGLISVETAHSAYDRMHHQRRRLPWDEVARQRRRWAARR